METKYSDLKINGFLMIFIIIALLALAVYLIVQGTAIAFILMGVIILFIALSANGFTMIEPNDMKVILFFGKYQGTITDNGFFWINPFTKKIKITARARNLNIEPIKVNDKKGNPIMIGLVLVWKVKDSYKAIFEIDSSGDSLDEDRNDIMRQLQLFVATQSDSALRSIASLYAYDDNEASDEVTLRSGGNEISNRLEDELNSRIAIAGVEVIEARISHLAYAPEIAAVMLRRQQATAVVAAKEKIVEGAVSMVKMALQQLADDNVIEFDDDKKATMVSNLLVVLCSDGQTQPVINTGTLHQ